MSDKPTVAFADFLYAEDAALRSIAAVSDNEAPDAWTDTISVSPY